MRRECLTCRCGCRGRLRRAPVAKSGRPARLIRAGAGLAAGRSLRGCWERAAAAPACACAVGAGQRLRAESAVTAAATARAATPARLADLPSRSEAGNRFRRCLARSPGSGAGCLGGFRCWPEVLDTACLLVGRDRAPWCHRLLVTPIGQPAARWRWRVQGRDVTVSDASRTLGAVGTHDAPDSAAVPSELRNHGPACRGPNVARPRVPAQASRRLALRPGPSRRCAPAPRVAAPGRSANQLGALLPASASGSRCPGL